MTHFTRLFALLALCLGGTGCIADHHLNADKDTPVRPGDPDPDPIACSVENPTCGEGQTCALVDPCGSPCPDGAAEDGLACPQVCVEVYACVEVLVIEDVCEPEMDRCGDGLICTLDDGRCGPTNCYDEGCAECPPVHTCQPHTIPTTCEALDCGPGFICVDGVSEGCGYADPVEQAACEAGQDQFAYCEEISEHIIGDSCEETECVYGYACEESEVYLPCDGPGCDQPVDVHVGCFPIEEHVIGETCADSQCMSGFTCAEEPVYLPCNGRGCDEPVDVHVSCVPNVEHIIGESCEETTCADGYECWESPGLICHGPGCDEDPVEISITCERPEPPIGVEGGPDPEQAPEPRPELPGEGEACAPSDNACAGDLKCVPDEEAGCQPSFCEGDICTTDCADVYVCQVVD